MFMQDTCVQKVVNRLSVKQIQRWLHTTPPPDIALTLPVFISSNVAVTQGLRSWIAQLVAQSSSLSECGSTRNAAVRELYLEHLYAECTNKSSKADD